MYIVHTYLDLKLEFQNARQDSRSLLTLVLGPEQWESSPFIFPFFLLLHFKKTILCQVKRKEFAILRSVLYYLTNKNIAISFCYVIKHTETYWLEMGQLWNTFAKELLRIFLGRKYTVYSMTYGRLWSRENYMH